MARERMTSTEIWLRLIDIGELYGERMVLLAQRLQQESHIDTAMLLTLGLTQKQTENSLPVHHTLSKAACAGLTNQIII